MGAGAPKADCMDREQFGVHEVDSECDAKSRQPHPGHSRWNSDIARHAADSRGPRREERQPEHCDRNSEDHRLWAGRHLFAVDQPGVWARQCDAISIVGDRQVRRHP